MDERRTELTKYCRSLIRWAEMNQAIIPPMVLRELLALIDQLLECA